MKKLLLIPLIALVLSGCQTTYDAKRAENAAAADSHTVVFVRPDKYSVFGTRSIRDYIQVAYEEADRNVAGLLQVKVGFRNIGGQHFWDTYGPNFAFAVKVTFYDKPVTASGPQGAPVYETNWQTVPVVRGDIAHYSAVCPVPQGAYYQVTVSEQLSR